MSKTKNGEYSELKVIKVFAEIMDNLNEQEQIQLTTMLVKRGITINIANY